MAFNSDGDYEGIFVPDNNTRLDSGMAPGSETLDFNIDPEHVDIASIAGVPISVEIVGGTIGDCISWDDGKKDKWDDLVERMGKI